MEAMDFVVQRTNTAPEWLIITGYLGLLAMTLGKTNTIRGLAQVVGYILLLTSRYLYSRKETDMAYTVASYGYMILASSLSFEHFWDSFAVMGYGLAILKDPHSRPFMGLYNALAVNTATGWLGVSARMALVFYLM